MAADPFVAVVDDDPDSAQMLVTCLRLDGVEACCQVTRRSAPDLLPPCVARHPAALIYDIGLPYEQGVRDFRSLRAASFPDVPVVLTTTDAGRPGRWLEKQEVLAVLLKPCDVRQVAALVRRGMGGKAAAKG